MKVELIDFKTMLISLKEGLYVLGIHKQQKVLIVMSKNLIHVRSETFSIKYSLDEFSENFKMYQFYLIHDELETGIDVEKDYDYYAFWRK